MGSVVGRTYAVVTDRRQIWRALRVWRDLLLSLGSGAERTITHPAGQVPNAHVIWIPGAPLWAYLGDTPIGGRHWCAYGTDPGEPTKPLNISLEINPPVEGVNRRVRGQVLRGETGGMFLAHKGGRGGGRGGQVTVEEFRRKITDVEIATVRWDEDGKEADMFILGDVASSETVATVSKYVRQAERLAEEARRRR